MEIVNDDKHRTLRVLVRDLRQVADDAVEESRIQTDAADDDDFSTFNAGMTIISERENFGLSTFDSAHDVFSEPFGADDLGAAFDRFTSDGLLSLSQQQTARITGSPGFML